jgi:hypothetical protein
MTKEPTIINATAVAMKTLYVKGYRDIILR